MDYYQWNSEQNKIGLVDEISRRFASGDIGILPTETVYGLMCSFDNTTGKDRIYKIKKRDPLKKLQVLIPSLRQLKKLSIPISEELQGLANKFWPGPLTVVLENLFGQEVGVRIPKHKIVLKVLERLGQPLLATSANLSGQNEESSYRNKFRDLALETNDFVVWAGECMGSPSTVIRLKRQSIQIIRPGAISAQKLNSVL